MTTYQQKKIEVIPQGFYPATITKVETVTGEYGTQEKFTFDLGGGRELLAWASGSFSNKSKLYRWVQNAIFGGKAVPESYNLDTAQFIGRSVILHVTQRQNTNGLFNKVEDILPPNLGQQQPQPVAIPAAQQQPANLFAVQPVQTVPPEPEFPDIGEI